VQAVEPRRHGGEARDRLVDEAEKEKAALVHLLMDRALSTSDKRMGTFYYVVAAHLRRLPVEYGGPHTVIATDGERIYVGDLYPLVKKKYGTRIVPFMWLHEVMHVLHAHPARMRVVDDPKLYNIVADLYVNELLSNRVGPIPSEFVTLSSFIKFILDEVGSELDPESVKALKVLAVQVTREEVTVEQAYAVIARIPKARQAILDSFGSSRFFGSDLPLPDAPVGGGGEDGGGGRDRPRPAVAEPVEEDEGVIRDPGPAGGAGVPVPAQEDRTGEAGPGSGESGESGRGKQSARGEDGAAGGEGQDGSRERGSGVGRGGDVEWLRRVLEEARRAVERVLSETRRAIGEYKGIRRHLRPEDVEGGAPPGVGEGVYGAAEYEELQRLRIRLERLLLREVGRVVRGYEVNFARFDRDAYWLPEDREQYASKIKVFLDTSSSIPLASVKLFMHWVNEAVRKYGIEADVIVFADGVIGKEEVDRRLEGVPLGGGTVWDETVAKEILEAAKEETPLAIVLSDFEIAVTREAEKAIEAFKRRGGKISCWSISGFAEWCDYKHRLPDLLRVTR